MNNTNFIAGNVTHLITNNDGLIGHIAYGQKSMTYEVATRWQVVFYGETGERVYERHNGSDAMRVALRELGKGEMISRT